MKAFVECPLAGVEIAEETFLRARNDWYGRMGWTEAGAPTTERIELLGLRELLAGAAVGAESLRT